MDEKTSPTPIHVSVTVLKQLFLYLNFLQVNVRAFLRSLNLDLEMIQSPDAYISLETYLLIQDEAARYTEDPYFGLHMGEFAEPGSWSILSYLMMNCKTLGEAFQKSTRYQRIIGNLIEGRVYLHDNQIKVVLSVPPFTRHMSRHCFESTISSSVRMMRNLTGVDLNPLQVTFTSPKPPSTAEYERVFCCPVHFGRPENSFTIPMSIINTPIKMANPQLLAYFEAYAQNFLTDMDHQNRNTRAVSRIILSNLDDEGLSIKKVAAEMAISVRTLQNRLKEEGVVFSTLHKDIRQKLAKKYLLENYSVEEITYLLGFSEPSSFRKAFKKWAGVTPGQFRNSPAPPARGVSRSA
ncbi:MAG: AraC family transcriptional regulator [Ardenticatenaceae bacterium]|nr:AraC family transcriptional regulator [Ardenticatenaceae bacterium]